MRNSFPSKRRGISLAVMLASAGMALPAVAQDQSDIEEVVVTGSYIRGSALDAPSPVTVVDRQSMQEQGAAVLWDVIRNLEVNQGSDTSVAGTSDAGQLTGTASVNLRNLGGNSTLTLINGKRFTPAAVVTSSGQEFVDLNAIPLMMTERVEVLTDGGSALYGSDAVAGVVNVIMRTDFEGLELYADVGGVAETGSDNERTIAGIWGWGSDDGQTNFVLSAEYFERDPISTVDSTWYSEELAEFNGRVGSLGNALELGATVDPSYINQELTDQKTAERAELGLATSRGSTLVLQDPLCTTLSGPAGPFYIDNRFSDFGDPNGNCNESTVQHDFIAVGAERLSLAATFEHSFSDTAEFYSFFQYSDADTEREGDGRTRSRSVHLFVPPPGTAQGPLSFIFDAFELGRYAELFGNTRPTADDITNSPLSVANGGPGVGMWTQNNVATGWPRQGNTLNTNNETAGIQAGFRGEFEVADRPIGYDISASWSYSSVEQNYLTLQRDRTELALQGLGGPNCTPNGVPDFNYTDPAVDPFGVWAGLADNFNDVAFPGYILNLRETISYALTSNNHGQGGCEFFNPFLTALTDPSLANSQELQDWMTQDLKRADKQNKLLVIDAVFNGDLWEMNGGTAAFAAGFQYRDRNAASIAPVQNQPGLTAVIDYDADGNPIFDNNITNNLECSNCIFNFDHDRDVSAAFVEFSLPFAENVETQVALRWEDYGGNIGSELTPKIAMSWRPIDELLVRGSFSQSFRAPNIGVIFESFEAFATTVLDPLRNQEVRAGLLPPTNENGENNNSFTVGAPNPNLGNESANTYSAGFQWTPGGDLEGLSVGADVWLFEVEDRVLPQVPRAALDPQIALFEQVAQDEGNYILNTSYELDADPRFVPCIPSELEAQFGRDSDERRNCVVDPRLYDIPTVDRLAGNTDADLVTIVLPAVNAGNIEVSGIDLKLGYTWDNDWGRFGVGLEYTHVHEYLVQDIPGLELGIQETGRTDAAGTDGEQAIVRSVPDNRGNIRFSWSRDNHSVTVFNRHIGSYEVLGHQDFIENPRENAFDIALARPKIASYDTWDIQYNYTHSWGNDSLGSTIFTVGVIDALNADLPLFRRAGTGALNSFDRSVFDARGRRWYARALWQF